MPGRPWFRLFANDWLASTKIALMSPAEEGAYVRLLAHAWNDPDCSIPDDDQELAVLSRLSEGWFNGGATMLRRCFTPHPTKPGRLINERLFAERQRADAWIEKSRIGGVTSRKRRPRKGAPSGVGKSAQSRVSEGWLKGGAANERPTGNGGATTAPTNEQPKAKLSDIRVRYQNQISDSDSDSESETDQEKEERKRVPPGAKQTRAPAAGSATEATSPTMRTWQAYAAAFHARYGVAPPRNAKTNGQIAQLVRRLGAEEAPLVAAWYCRHHAALYVHAGHCTDLLLRDAEKLRTEWARGRTITQTQARQGDQTAARIQAAEGAKDILRRMQTGGPTREGVSDARNEQHD